MFACFAFARLDTLQGVGFVPFPQEENAHIKGTRKKKKNKLSCSFKLQVLRCQKKKKKGQATLALEKQTIGDDTTLKFLPRCHGF